MVASPLPFRILEAAAPRWSATTWCPPRPTRRWRSPPQPWPDAPAASVARCACPPRRHPGAGSGVPPTRSPGRCRPRPGCRDRTALHASPARGRPWRPPRAPCGPGARAPRTVNIGSPGFAGHALDPGRPGAAPSAPGLAAAEFPFGDAAHPVPQMLGARVGLLRHFCLTCLALPLTGYLRRS